MIFGIGIDILESARVTKMYQRYGRRFAERILMPEELTMFSESDRPERFLGMRFAAKEAIVKAYHRFTVAEQKLKNARAEGMKSKEEANKALETAIEAPDATVKEIVQKLADKKQAQADAAEAVSECNKEAKEAKSALDELIKSADQYGLFPDEPERGSRAEQPPAADEIPPRERFPVIIVGLLFLKSFAHRSPGRFVGWDADS